MNDEQHRAKDKENAARRQEIARRLNAAYHQVKRWALGAFGPGWLPSCRHFLMGKDEEEKHRREGGEIKPAAVVYCVKNKGGDRKFFVVDGGRVREVASYEEGFGPMLYEPDPVRTMKDFKGQEFRPHRYSLCWGGYELYHPKTGEQLSELRESRRRKKAERERAKWRKDNPLLALIEDNADGAAEA